MFVFGPRRAATKVDKLLALCRTLLSTRGDVSGARLASEVIAAWRSLDGRGIETFFDHLASEFSPDAAAVQIAAAAYNREPSEAHLVRLQRVVESPRQELFRRWNMAPEGVGVLIQVRRQLLETLRAHPERVGIDTDLMHLFRSWFNRGFLVLQRIDWRTPAVILERLIEYE